ncbi:MAG: EscU/YscU/HrcU family type III secretion system export apparatus switch protein [Rhodobacteraceae bacterium]|nr:EscU/YscU/HrcU family type III secretion system export apparatus switch protein [Paracoccaceae bacterium]
MSSEQAPADKPHEPTPRKLEEARRKGDIVRSADVNGAVTYIGFLAAAAWLGLWASDRIGGVARHAWAEADRLASLLLSPGGQAAARPLIAVPMVAVAGVVAVPAVLLLATLIAQRAILVTPSKLTPRLDRVSPIANARQKYGAQGLFQFAKSAVKLVVITVLLGLFLHLRAETILVALHADAGQMLTGLARLVFDFQAVIAALATVIAAIDWLWEWTQHRNKNRMSRQEVMDETKSSEGDPQLRQQRRQRGQALAMNRMMADVPGADVVIVNPTHYAVALRWDRGQGALPVCVAKGVDATAARIRARAAETGVPIHSDPPTARALHAGVEIGGPIRPDHFVAVAAAIRFADAMRLKARRRRS